jgi:hypothetical protein
LKKADSGEEPVGVGLTLISFMQPYNMAAVALWKGNDEYMRPADVTRRNKVNRGFRHASV